MNTPDLITILANVSKSLAPVQHLIAGGSYLLGIILISIALHELKSKANQGKSSHEGFFLPLAYMGMGAFLLFLPSTMEVLTNTAFGSSSVISYIQISPISIYRSMTVIMQTVGILWFVRGCVLVAAASHPGKQHGVKGLIFIIAGILAVNFQYSISMANYLVDNLVSMSISVKTSQGY